MEACFLFERMTRVELASLAWEANALPLCYMREGLRIHQPQASRV